LAGRTIGYLPEHIAYPYVHKGILKSISKGVKPRVEPVVLISGTGMSKFRLSAKLFELIVHAHRNEN